MKKKLLRQLIFALLFMVMLIGSLQTSYAEENKKLIAGQSHTLALMNDGTVKAWGNNFSGQLGIGTSEIILTPYQAIIRFILLKITATTPITWNKTNTVSVSITGSQDGIAIQKWASGSQNIGYFTTGGTIFTGNSFTVSTNGTYTIYAKDNAGNEAITTITVNRVDATAPDGSATLTPSTPTDDSVTINFTGTDAESGVASITKPDGTIVAGSTASYVVNDNGAYSFTVTDNAGNEKVITVTVSNIDKTPPITEPSLEGQKGNNGWYISEVKVTLTATDNAGGSGRYPLLRTTPLLSSHCSCIPPPVAAALSYSLFIPPLLGFMEIFSHCQYLLTMHPFIKRL